VDIAALILWIATAGGGFYLLGTWIAKGGARGGNSNFPPPLIFGHFVLAAAGLIVWIAYVATDSDAAGWIAFVMLAVVALLGFTMLARWIPTYRAGHASTPATSSGPATSNVATAQSATAVAPAERHFPLAIVIGHGVLAATTLVLVLLSVLEVGGS
jgi:uncharacterized membrane-anchored protein